ncbi:MAG: S4 domain-containing protein, partial [Acidobacteriota bacterium]|nr:S4 domain-containing protein [Acidobacteriota bacterium]
YYELVTNVSLDGIAQMKRLVKQGTLHPKKAKEGLATRIVTDFYDENAAREAGQEFERIFRQGKTPDEIAEHKVPAGDGRVPLARLLVRLEMAKSNGEATRLIRQGAVSIDRVKIAADTREIDVRAGDSRLIKVGKRRFARVLFT